MRKRTRNGAGRVVHREGKYVYVGGVACGSLLLWEGFVLFWVVALLQLG